MPCFGFGTFEMLGDKKEIYSEPPKDITDFTSATNTKGLFGFATLYVARTMVYRRGTGCEMEVGC